MTHASELLLDPQIRDWVLLPIIVVIWIVTILRQNVTTILRSDKKADIKSLRDTNMLQRTQRLRTNANLIPQHAFRMRKVYFNGENGILKPKIVAPANPLANNPLMDPANSMDMVKKNVVMIVPQIGMMSWVNHFFSGFVLLKMPFSLTPAFRSMLQRGVELSTLDMAYVSSLSWYFLTFFGMRGIMGLLMEEVPDDAAMMQQQMGGAAGGAQVPDPSKVFLSEKEGLELVKHEFSLDSIEAKLVGLKEKDA